MNLALTALTPRCRLAAVSTVRNCVRQVHRKPGPPGGPEDHGEKIWIFDNLHTNQIIYSFSEIIDSNKGMRQLTFHGKKTKPAKLRKDYWRTLAMVQFAEGHGVVGRSVFQKMRELRKLHEVKWGDELLVSRKRRGWMLMDQKANAIADLAAVLAGRGLGNLICVDKKNTSKPYLPRKLTQAMYRARVLWADMDDRNYATAWSGNVIHAQLQTVVQAMTEITEAATAVPLPEAAAETSKTDANDDGSTEDAQVVAAETAQEQTAPDEIETAADRRAGGDELTGTGNIDGGESKAAELEGAGAESTESQASEATKTAEPEPTAAEPTAAEPTAAEPTAAEKPEEAIDILKELWYPEGIIPVQETA